jgi:hypothetical protein
VLTRTSQHVEAGGDAAALQDAIAADLAGCAFDDFQTSLHKATAERAVRQLLS